MRAVFAARKEGRVAGLDCARIALRLLDPHARLRAGARGRRGRRARRCRSPASRANARAVLAAERTALNLMQPPVGDRHPDPRLRPRGGRARARASPTRARPRRACGRWRSTPCAAAAALNHRFGLDDAILIKDNHVAACGGVGPALERARAAAGPPGQDRGRGRQPGPARGGPAAAART